MRNVFTPSRSDVINLLYRQLQLSGHGRGALSARSVKLSGEKLDIFWSGTCSAVYQTPSKVGQSGGTRSRETEADK